MTKTKSYSDDSLKHNIFFFNNKKIIDLFKVGPDTQRMPYVKKKEKMKVLNQNFGTFVKSNLLLLPTYYLLLITYKSLAIKRLTKEKKM